MQRFGFAALALMLASGSAYAADPLGDWMVESGDGIVRITPCGAPAAETTAPPAHRRGAAAAPSRQAPPPPPAPAANATLCGHIVWAKPPQPGDRNYDPASKESPIGTKILLEMKPTGDNRWEGDIYNPQNGKIYTSYIKLKSPDVLRVEGCVLGFLCGGQDWTRTQAPTQATETKPPASTHGKSTPSRTVGAGR